MSVKTKSDLQTVGHVANETGELYTKDDREQLLDRKIAQMRERNEELQRKHQLKEADRRQAELSGCAVQLRQTSTSPIGHHHVNNEEESWEDETSPCEPRTKQKAGNGNQPSAKQRLGNRTSNLATDSSPMAETTASQPRQLFSSRKQQVLSKDDPPPDPVNRFLSDPRRNNGRDSIDNDSTLPSRDQRYQRNHRNYGGENFENVPRTIEAQKNRQSGMRAQPTRNLSKTDYQLSTTGSQRREQEMWRMEREKIDNERILRQKQADGRWRREWDAQKIEQESSDVDSTYNLSGNIQTKLTPTAHKDANDCTQNEVTSSGQKDQVQSVKSSAKQDAPSTGNKGRGRGRGRPRQGPDSSSDQSTAVVGRMSRVERGGSPNVDSISVELPSSQHVVVTPASLPSSRDRTKKLRVDGLPLREADAGVVSPPGLSSSQDLNKISSSKEMKHEFPSVERRLNCRSSDTERRKVFTNEGQVLVKIESMANAKPSASKYSKIGSGRLGKVDTNAVSARSDNTRAPVGKGRKQNSRQRPDVWDQEKPVMIGLAVISTPGDPGDEHSMALISTQGGAEDRCSMAVISTPGDPEDRRSNTLGNVVEQKPVSRKGILKPAKEVKYSQSDMSQIHDDEDLVVDWNKEVAEAGRRRKAMEQSVNVQQVLEKNGAISIVCQDSHNDKKSTTKKDSKQEKANNIEREINEVAEDDNDNGGDDEDEWEDVDDEGDFDEDEDLHNNSSESFEQFIKENTLKLDIDCTQQVWMQRTGDTLTPGSLSDGSSILKTPTGHVHVIDWGDEMEAQSDHNTCTNVDDDVVKQAGADRPCSDQQPAGADIPCSDEQPAGAVIQDGDEQPAGADGQSREQHFVISEENCPKVHVTVEQLVHAQCNEPLNVVDEHCGIRQSVGGDQSVNEQYGEHPLTANVREEHAQTADTHAPPVDELCSEEKCCKHPAVTEEHSAVADEHQSERSAVTEEHSAVANEQGGEIPAVTEEHSAVADEQQSERSAVTEEHSAVANEQGGEIPAVIEEHSAVADEQQSERSAVTEEHSAVANEQGGEIPAVTEEHSAVADEQQSERSAVTEENSAVANEQGGEIPAVTEEQSAVANEQQGELPAVTEEHSAVADEQQSERSAVTEEHSAVADEQRSELPAVAEEHCAVANG